MSSTPLRETPVLPTVEADSAGQELPSISVILCCHDVARYPMLVEAIESVREQAYAAHEIIVVSDGSAAVGRRVREDYGDVDVVRTVLLPENRGLLPARNVGAKVATGDVVAFTDDDAEASRYWLAELARLYPHEDALAAGGQLRPDYQEGEPVWMPDEFGWLIGMTHDGFAPEKGTTEVRNTFGANISFRREVFTALGGFGGATEDGYGRQGDGQLQAGETELCVRLRDRYGEAVHYSPEAVVYHKITEQRTDPAWCCRRAFWQGYSKAVLADDHAEADADTLDEEQDYLRSLATRAVPERVAQLVMLPVFVAMVGLGFLLGQVRDRL